MATSELHVVFGSGPLGKWTARELARMGKRVRMINRSGVAPNMPAAVEVVAGNAYDAARNRELTAAASAVYQCAQPEYHEWPAKFMSMQTAILDAAAANGARFIAAENVYMYGDTHGSPMTEATPYLAHTRKGKVRQAMTEAIFAAHRAGTVRAATVRGSDFFGPDELIYGDNVFAAALLGRKVNAMARLDQPHTWTYAPDFGKALAIAGTRDEALGQAWHAPSNAPLTQQQLVDLIAAEAGRPVKAVAGGQLLFRALGLFNKTLAELPEMMYEFDQPFIVDSTRFTQTFGLTATPMRDAVRSTLDWNRERISAVGAETAAATTQRLDTGILS